MNRLRPRYKNMLAGLRKIARRLLGRTPDSPGDPYSYVTAPKKPRLPHLSAAAVADLPED